MGRNRGNIRFVSGPPKVGRRSSSGSSGSSGSSRSSTNRFTGGRAGVSPVSGRSGGSPGGVRTPSPQSTSSGSFSSGGVTFNLGANNNITSGDIASQFRQSTGRSISQSELQKAIADRSAFLNPRTPGFQEGIQRTQGQDRITIRKGDDVRNIPTANLGSFLRSGFSLNDQQQPGAALGRLPAGTNINNLVDVRPELQVRPDQSKFTFDKAFDVQPQQPPFTPPPRPEFPGLDFGRLSALQQQRLALFEPTEEERKRQDEIDALQARLANLTASKDLGLAKIEDQPIALDFITGQQRSLERRAATQAGALEAQQRPLLERLAREQERREAQARALEAQLAFEDKNIDRTLGQERFEREFGLRQRQFEADLQRQARIDALNKSQEARQVASLLMDIPEGRTVDIGGTTYQGMGSPTPNTQVFREVDRVTGKQTFVTINKDTGEIINVTDTGEEAIASIGGVGGGGGRRRSNRRSNNSPDSSNEELFDDDEIATAHRGRFGDIFNMGRQGVLSN